MPTEKSPQSSRPSVSVNFAPEPSIGLECDRALGSYVFAVDQGATPCDAIDKLNSYPSYAVGHVQRIAKKIKEIEPSNKYGL